MTPLHYKASVARDWVDYNGHMRDGFYMVAFSSAIDQLMDELGLDEAYRQRHKTTLYTIEAHVIFVQEAHEGEGLTIDSLLLDHDAKRLHLFQSMTSSAGALLATQETMLMHIDQSAGPKSAPFAADIAKRIEALAKEQKNRPRPEQAGRAIGIKRKG